MNKLNYSTCLKTEFNNAIEANINNFIASFTPNFVSNYVEKALDYIPLSKATTYLFSDYIIDYADVRLEYKQKVNEINNRYQTKLESGELIDESFARELSDARNEIKHLEREMTNFIGRTFIYSRNLINDLSKNGISDLKLDSTILTQLSEKMEGPDFETLLKEGKTFEQIARSAGKTGGQDLGLESPLFKSLFEILENQETYCPITDNTSINNHSNEISLIGVGFEKIIPSSTLINDFNFIEVY